MDFGPDAWNGERRWLEIGVRTNASAAYVALNPRMPIISVPYANYSIRAEQLTGNLPTNQLGGTYNQAVNLSNPGNQYSGAASGLTSLNASELTFGTVPDARLSSAIARINDLIATNNALINLLNANNTALLTALTVQSNNLAAQLDASNTNSSAGIGSVSNALSDRLVATNTALLFNVTTASNSLQAALTSEVAERVALGSQILVGDNTFAGSNLFTGEVQLTNANNVVAGNGAALTSLNAAQLTSGTVPDARLGSTIARSADLVATNNSILAQLSGNNSSLQSSLSLASNDLSARLIATNAALVTRIDGATNELNTRMTSTDAALQNSLTVSSNALQTGIDSEGAARVALQNQLLTGDNAFSGSNHFSGIAVLTNGANMISGDGAGLTNLQFGGVTGTIGDNQLTANVSLLDQSQTASGNKTFSGTVNMLNAQNAIGGDGSALTGLDGGQITTGLIPDARLNTSIARVADVDGDLTTASNGLSSRLVATNTALVSTINISSNVLRTDLNNVNVDLANDLLTTSNGLSGRLLSTNTALLQTMDDTSNDLSGRLIATNAALVSLVDGTSNGLSGRLEATNSALIGVISSSSNVLKTDIGNLNASLASDLLTTSNGLSSRLMDTNNALISGITTTSNGLQSAIDAEGSARSALQSQLLTGANTFVGSNNFSGSNHFSGLMVLTNGANELAGDGAGLTNLQFGGLTGTINDNQLSANVGLLDQNQTASGNKTFSGTVSMLNAQNAIGGDGSALTGLNGAQISTGLIPDARLNSTIARAVDVDSAITVASNGLDGRLLATNVALVSVINSSSNVLRTDLDSLDSTAAANLLTTSNGLSGRLVATNAALVSLVNSSSNALETDINNVSSSLSSDLLTTSNGLSGRLVDTNNALMSKITTTSNGLQSAIDSEGSARLALQTQLLTGDNTFSGSNVYSGSNHFSGIITATNTNSAFHGSFTGNGAGLTNLQFGGLTGTINDNQLSANVGLLDQNQTASGNKTFSGTVSMLNAQNAIGGDGSALTGLNGAQISTGLIPDARLNSTIARAVDVDSAITVASNGLDGRLLATNVALVSVINSSSNVLRTDLDSLDSTAAANLLTTSNGLTGRLAATNAALVSLVNSSSNVLQTDINNVSSSLSADLLTTSNGLSGRLIDTNSALMSKITTTSNGLQSAIDSEGSARSALQTQLLTGNNTFSGSNVFSGSNHFSGIITSTNTNSAFHGSFTGNGAGLTNLQFGGLTGTINDNQLSANVGLLDQNQTASGNKTFSGTVSMLNAQNAIGGDGSALTGLNGAQISTGLIPDARLNSTIARAVDVDSAITVASNGLDGRLLATNVALVSVINSSSNVLRTDLDSLDSTAAANLLTTSNGLTGRLVATNAALVSLVTSSSNVLQTDINNVSSSLSADLLTTSNGLSGRLIDTNSALMSKITTTSNGLQSAIDSEGSARLALQTQILTGNNTFSGSNVLSGSNYFSGIVTATNTNSAFHGSFTGNGAGLTNLQFGGLTGTINDNQLSANVNLLDTAQTVGGAKTFTADNVFSGSNHFSGIAWLTNAGNSIAGDGSALTALNADNISSGTLSVSRLPSAVLQEVEGSVVTSAGISASSFSGDGASLTALNGSQVTSGTVADARLSANVNLLDTAQSVSGAKTFTADNVFSGSNHFSGVVTLTNAGSEIAGVGSGLTSLNGSQVTSGTVADGRLSANVNLLDSAQTVSGAKTFSANNVFSATNSFAGSNHFSGIVVATNAANQIVADGSGLTSLNADNISSGTLSVSRLPSAVLQEVEGSVVTSAGISASSFSGDGASLTALNGSQVTSGTVADARLSANVNLLDTAQSVSGAKTFTADNVFSGSNHFGGVVTLTNAGSEIAGVGSGLTSLNGSQVTSGTVADGRLSANVNLLDSAQTVSGAKTFSAANVFSGDNSHTGTNTFSGSNHFSGVVVATNTANLIVANGSGLTDLNADNITSGTLSMARLPSEVLREVEGSVFTSASITASSFSGDGSSLTALNGTQVTSGTVADARLSANVGLLDTAQTISGAKSFSADNVFSGSNHFSGVVALTNAGSTIAGDGSGLTSLNGSQVTAGTVADARLSSNVGRLDAAQTVSGVKTFTAGNIFSGDNTFSGTNAFGASNHFSGIVVATNVGNVIVADGSGLTDLNAANITSGTMVDARLSANIPRLDDSTPTFTGSLTAGTVNGDGSGLTSLNGTQVTSGTVADARLSTNVGLLDTAQTVSGAKTFSADNVFSGSNHFSGVVTLTNTGNTIVGIGAGLTSLNASSLDSGTLSSGLLSGTYSEAVTLGNSGNSISGTIQPSANSFTAGSTQLVVTATGVGVGTASPTVRLDVHGTSRSWQFLGGTGSVDNGSFNFIGGGGFHIVNANSAVSGIGSGDTNRILDSAVSFIGGGESNLVDSSYGGFIGGGGLNSMFATTHGTIAGGLGNVVANEGLKGPVVGGGFSNEVSGGYAVIGGGMMNTNGGLYGTIPGGWQNLVDGLYGFAAGRRAKANHDGAFVWADSTDADFASTVADSFNVRASGGVVLNTSGTGATLDGSAILTASSGVTPSGNNAFAGDNVFSGNNTFSKTNAFSGSNHFSGIVMVTNAGNVVSGIGSGLTSLNASQLALGTVADGRLSSNIGFLDGTNVLSGTNRFAGEVILTNAANTIAGDGSGLSGLWRTAGNAGTTPGTDFLGTTDNQAIVFKANNLQIGRLTPAPDDGAPNVLFGAEINFINAANYGSTISGGGATSFESEGIESNSIVANYATIAGGVGNHILSGGHTSVIGGGEANQIDTNANHSVIAGGVLNTIGNDADLSAVGGGRNNYVTNDYATVPGGRDNQAGGLYSFAAGRRAKADADGAFVWADSQNADYQTTTADSFNVRAQGGVNINASSGTIALLGGNFTLNGSDILTSGAGVELTADNTISGNNTFTKTNAFQGSNHFSGIVIATNSANVLVGDGSSITSLDASAIATGELADSRLSSNVPLLSSGATFAGIVGGTALNIGSSHTLGGTATSIAGGLGNNVSANYSFIGGGTNNSISDFIFGLRSAIVGGTDNRIDGSDSFIGGGRSNYVQSATPYITVGGGATNVVQLGSQLSVIGGGFSNRIQSGEFAVIGGGERNFVGGESDYGTIPGGLDNEVTKSYGFAAGRRAKVNHQGAFVWADSQDSDFASSTADSFNVRAQGGVNYQLGTGNLEITTSGNVQVNGSDVLTSGSGVTSGADNSFTGNNMFTKTNVFQGSNHLSGILIATNTANVLVGNGVDITSLNASALASGELADARLSSNVPLLSGGATFSGEVGGTALNVGLGHSLAGANSSIAGGSTNTINGNATNAFIGGGQGNNISASGAFGAVSDFSVIVGGVSHTITNSVYSFIGGGYGNVIPADSAFNFIGGGEGNTFSLAGYGTIVGGHSNIAGGEASYNFIGGGDHNTAWNSGSAVVGGRTNYAGGTDSFVGGGRKNTTGGGWATVGGGAGMRPEINMRSLEEVIPTRSLRPTA